MFNSIYILDELSAFLNDRISGSVIKEIFSREKNKLVIVTGKSEKTSAGYLEFSCLNSLPYISFREKFSDGGKNTADIFPEIPDLIIEKIRLCNNDRIIDFFLSNNLIIRFVFITSKVNCLIIDNGIIVNAFKQRNSILGISFDDYSRVKSKENTEFTESTAVKFYLKNKFRQLPKLLIDEILFRTNLKPDSIADVPVKNILDKSFDEITEQLRNPSYLLYLRDDIPCISLIESELLKQYPSERFNDVNELIIKYITITRRNESYKSLKDNKIEKLNGSIGKIDKSISALKLQLGEAENYMKYNEYGSIILANLYNINPGATELICEDFNGNSVNIKLKNNLSPADNAEKYFSKAKRIKESSGILKRKINRLESDKMELEQKLEVLKQTKEIKTLVKMEKAEQKENDSEETKQFRKFIIDEKFEVWVGKNSASNDELTMRHSSPHDLWFHVRGASGSHTVLKIQDKKVQIDKKYIRIAASIAAYYSKAKNAGNVPVAYCERKYIKKKKGLNQGAVIMEREKVIFVKPELPEN